VRDGTVCLYQSVTAVVWSYSFCCCHDEPIRLCLHGGQMSWRLKKWGIPRDCHSYYMTAIGNHVQAVKWCHFQCPWVTRDPDFNSIHGFVSDSWVFLLTVVCGRAQKPKPLIVIVHLLLYFCIQAKFQHEGCRSQMWHRSLAFAWNAAFYLEMNKEAPEVAKFSHYLVVTCYT